MRRLWPVLMGAALGGPAVPPAQAAAPTPVATPVAASDPCGGDGLLLATLNRPTVGYSACAVPKGSLVLEEGYQNQYRGGGGASVTTSYPQGFERFGVAPGVEVDVIGPNFNRSRATGAVTSGSSDAGAGFKVELPQRGRFVYALDGLFTPASGTGGFGAGGPTETLDADISYTLSPAVGIGTTLSTSSTAQAAARFGFFLPSLVVTVQVPPKYQFYGELVGQTKLGPGQGGHIFTDFGVQKLLSRFVELDAEYGIELTPVGGSRFKYVGAGVGVRLL